MENKNQGRNQEQYRQKESQLERQSAGAAYEPDQSVDRQSESPTMYYREASFVVYGNEGHGAGSLGCRVSAGDINTGEDGYPLEEDIKKYAEKKGVRQRDASERAKRAKLMEASRFLYGGEILCESGGRVKDISNLLMDGEISKDENGRPSRESMFRYWERQFYGEEISQGEETISPEEASDFLHGGHNENNAITGIKRLIKNGKITADEQGRPYKDSFFRYWQDMVPCQKTSSEYYGRTRWAREE